MAHGPADVLIAGTAPDPEPGPRDILVRVLAAGVNFADIQRRRGGYPDAPTPPYIPGFEVAGTVVAAGTAVRQGLQPGDRVVGFSAEGGYREVALVPAGQAYRLPDGVGLDTAAAILVNGVTARQLLSRVGRLRQDESVLVTAAAGGVGQLCLRLAGLATSGAIIGLVGEASKVPAARAAGARHALTYDDPRLAVRLAELTNGRGVDVVLDSVGGGLTARLLDALAADGRLVLFGRSSGPAGSAGLDSVFVRSQHISGYSGATFRARHPRATRHDVGHVLGLAATGVLAPAIEARVPLERAADAHRLLESRTTRGKVLLVAG